MNFGQAIDILKKGLHVTRIGWNGRGMYLYLQNFEVWNEDHGPTYEPCIVMYTAHGTFQPGWLASQADMLADDWIEVLK